MLIHLRGSIKSSTKAAFGNLRLRWDVDVQISADKDELCKKDPLLFKEKNQEVRKQKNRVTVENFTR